MEVLKGLQLLKNATFSSEINSDLDRSFIKENVTISSAPNGYIIRRVIKNEGKTPENLQNLKFTISNFSFNGKAENDYFYVNENARIYCTLTLPLDYNRVNDDLEENKKFNAKCSSKWCDNGVREGRICSSPYQAIPAILLSNYECNNGLVVGTLSQDYFYHSYEVGHSDGKAFIEIYSGFKNTAYRIVKPNEELVDIFYLGETDKANDINSFFDGYLKVLRCYLKDNYGATETNRHTLIWDSWNDGIYRNVNQKMLIEEAIAVKKHFPSVEWFQLDDGYSSYCEENVDLDAHGLGVAYEGDEGVDSVKFPNGLKGYTDKIKELGLKPAIWIGAWCPVKSKIYKEKPEWFLPYQYRVSFCQPLDVSNKEVRNYMSFALDKMLTEYGFEGIKHDFWTFAFEDRHDFYKNKEKSGYEYRTWWQKEIRNHVKDGYVGTAVDLSFGNPFNGKYFNNHRFGIDVGAGKWSNVQASMFWSVAVLAHHTGDLYIPNSDSIGLLPGISDDDFLFVVNWQIITRTLVEISGRFSRVSEDNKRLKVLKRAVKYLNNGESVYFAKYDYRKKGEVLPEIFFINSAFDCDDKGYKTVALFNSGEQEKVISFTPSDIGLKEKEYLVENVWEETTKTLSEFSYKLKGHQSVLLKIKI